VVIVDITGNNPNVFFELGIARTAKPGTKVLIVGARGTGTIAAPPRTRSRRM
jgi:hypothetical protein